MTGIQKSFMADALYDLGSRKSGELVCSMIDFGARRNELINDDPDWLKFLNDNGITYVEKPMMVDFYLK